MNIIVGSTDSTLPVNILNNIDTNQINSTDKPTYDTQLEISMDSLFVNDELFDLRMSDAKELFSEAIIADMTNDTMSAEY